MIQLTASTNGLYHEWALPGLLSVFLLALVQVGYVVLTKKERIVTAHYLQIREVLAGTFRRTLLTEVRSVFQKVEDHIISTLIRREPGEGGSARFELLAEGLREVDEEDGDAQDYQRVLRGALAGVLVDRVDALIAEAEGQDHDGQAAGDRTRVSISFAESTVDDFVYLARALHLTRRHRRRFYTGRDWARRCLYVLIPSFAILVVSMLVSQPWAYWLGLASLGAFILAVFGALIACSVSLGGQSWLEERAEAPDAAELFRSELQNS